MFKLDFIMSKYCRQEKESSAAIRSLNQREHTLSPNMLRSFFSAIGLGAQVWLFYLSCNENFVSDHELMTKFWKLII